jgi:hypothetical protein
MEKHKYKFVREDYGNCRIYYRERQKLFCMQDDGVWGKREVNFYRCSRDGEPSHKVNMPEKSEFDRYMEP